LYIQNNERIVFDQIANGVDPNVEINTSTGELKCETLIVQNNLNISSPSLTVYGGIETDFLIINNETQNNAYTDIDKEIVSSFVLNENVNKISLDKVFEINRNGEAIKMIGNHNFITGNNLNNERMFYIGTPNTDSNVLHIVNTADGDINIKTTGTGKVLLNNEDITNIVQDIELLKEDVDIALIQNSNASSSPTGSVIAFAGVNPPAGWLLCNGQIVLKLEYSDLYAVIGDLYEFIGSVQNPLDLAGQTSNFNQFRLPDLRQAYISGAGIQTTNFTKLTQPEKILGRFSDMSVQDHGHIYVSTNEQESASTGGVMTAQVGNDRKTELKTSGIFHADGTIMGDGVTQPLNIAMNYIIKT
jgi:microcystin-dependent protein